MPNHYFVHVPKDSADNYVRGIEALIWGWKTEALSKRNRRLGNVTNQVIAGGITLGDILVLAHRGPDPRGLSEDQYVDGAFRDVTVFRVRRTLYVSQTQVWDFTDDEDDELYPNRVDLEFVQRGDRWGEAELGREGMIALQRSANAGGVPIPADLRLLPFEAGLVSDPLPDLIDPSQTTDAYTWAVRRLEQARLRNAKLRGRTQAPCDICGRVLPVHLIRAAHIKPRAICTETERADLANIMLACVLGCDALFEAGHIAIDAHGGVCVPQPLTGDLGVMASPLTGRTVTTDSRTLEYAAVHRAKHEPQTPIPHGGA